MANGTGFAPYLSFLTETFIVPKHILEKEANPNNAAFNQAPVGTGAFKWGKRVAGDHLELVANPEYFGEGPHIEKLIFKYIPDLTVLYTQFKSGDVDLMGQPYITADHYEEAKALANRVVTLVPKASFESFYLNLERPQFKELAVREALYAAIDKESIIQGSITACRLRRRPSCRGSPPTITPIFRHTHTIWTARARSSTKPAGRPGGMAFVPKAASVCPLPARPRQAIRFASRCSSSCSRHLLSWASR